MRNKNKFKRYLVALALLPLLAGSLAFAEHGEDTETHGLETAPAVERKKNPSDSTTTQRKPETTQNIREKVQENLDTARQKASEKLDQAREQRLAMLKKLMQNQLTRAQKAIERLSGIITRIEERRARLASAGSDLTLVDAAITKAKAQKTEAEQALAKVKTDMAAIESATEMEMKKQAVQTFMNSVKNLNIEIRELHKALKDIVVEMKKVAPKPVTEPTPTPTPAPGNEGQEE